MGLQCMRYMLSLQPLELLVTTVRYSHRAFDLILTSQEYPLLWKASQSELKILTLTLEELSKTWQTAKGTLKILNRLYESISLIKSVPDPPPLDPGNLDMSLFEPFGPDFCQKWRIVVSNSSINPRYHELEQTSVAGDGDVNDHDVSGESNPHWIRSVQDNGGAMTVGLSELSPPSIMSSMFEGVSADSLYSYGNWFLEDNFV